MRTYLTEAIKDYKIKLSEEQFSQFERYFELLCEWNEKINLTAITDPKGVAVKHFADSLSIFNYIDVPQNARVIDVGTGAGFPGVVLKIARPDIQLTLLDSLQKRLNFLSVVCDELNLDAELIHSRAEEGGQDLDLREGFFQSGGTAEYSQRVLHSVRKTFGQLRRLQGYSRGRDKSREKGNRNPRRKN